MLKTAFLTLQDITVAYTEHGTGPTVILLHGNSLDKSIFHHWQTGFLKGFRTIAIDSRGHGESRSEDNCYSYEQFADDTVQFCEKLNIQRAFLIGYSDGANTGLFLGRKAPELFPHMVLISPEYLVSATKRHAYLLMKAARTVFALLETVRFPVKRWVMRFDLMLRDYGLSAEDLQQIQSRVLLIHAENDIIYTDHFHEMHRLIPNSERIELAKCGHMSQLLKPEISIRIGRFLSAVPPLAERV